MKTEEIKGSTIELLDETNRDILEDQLARRRKGEDRAYELE